MTPSRWVVLLLCLAMAAGSNAAATYQWQCHGPYPGTFTKVAVAPNPWDGAFAVQRDGGFFFGAEDLDGETLWQPRNDGLPHLVLTAVAASLSGGDVVVWAGTTSGLWRSTTWGSTWTSNPDIGMKYIVCIAGRPLVGVAEWIVYVGSTDGTVYASTDAGASWVDRTGNLPGSPVHSLAVDPTNVSIVYAGLYDGSVYQSTNGGVNWTQALGGDGTARASAIVVNPRYPTKVFVGYDPTETDGRNGVYRSTNSGGNWTKTALSLPVNCLAIDPQQPDNLYAGSDGSADTAAVYRTSNDGLTWKDCDDGIRSGDSEVSVESLVMNPTYLSPDGLLAGTSDGGICYSTDKGVNWRWQYRGLAIPGVPTVAPQPDDPYRVYAGSAFGGCWGSLNGGWTWGKLDTGVPGNLPPDAVAAMAVAPGGGYFPEVYAATDGAELYKSTNGGSAWISLLTDRWILDMEVLPQDPDTVYSAGLWANWVMASFFYTTDAGANWETRGPSSNRGYALAVHPTNPQIVYLGTDSFVAVPQYRHTLFKSTDGGWTWTESDNGINGVTVRSLVIHPTNPSLLYAGLEHDGVYRSTNAGVSWASTGPDLGAYTITTLAIDPHWTSTLMAGTQYYGVYRSYNGGVTWHDVSAGLDVGTVTQLAFHGNSHGLAFAATDNGGVYFRRFLFDLNLDNVFDYLDLWELKWFLSESIPELAAGPGSADVNDDMKVNVVDLLRMRLAMY